MKSAKLGITAFALLVALSIPVSLAAHEQQNKKSSNYTVTDLGTLGGTFSQGEGVNNKGWATGFATLPGDLNQHGFLWRHGALIDLGTLGGPNSNAFVPNEKGVIPGFSETSTPDPLGEDVCGFGTHLICLPVLWTGGHIAPLPILGGNNGQAYVINQRGQAGGFAENPNLDPTCSTATLQVRAVVWQEGNIIRQLNPLPGDISTLGGGINDLGDVPAGSGSCSSGILHALLWQHDGTVTDLGNLGGTTNNNAFGINDRDQVTGFSNLPGDTMHHAFLWTKESGIQDLGTLPGDVLSETESINDKGQVPGVSCDINFNCRAFMWQNGVMTDMNTLIPPNSPLYLLAVYDINQVGQVVGIAMTRTGELHAFLGTPCDNDQADTEGCDYSMMEGTTAASQTRPAVREASTHTLPQSLMRRMNRYHFVGAVVGPIN
jgi:probable HAF family extracellular repeat protein